MKNLVTLCSVFFLFAGLNSYSQNTLNSPDELHQISNQVSLNEITSLPQIQKNHVHITQIGNQNETDATIKASESDINLYQNGFYNNISVDVNVNRLKGRIIQNGNYNYSFDFVNNPSEDLTLNLIQNGNGHHYESYGANSISNKLSIEMTGESQALIVRNFN